MSHKSDCEQITMTLQTMIDNVKILIKNHKLHLGLVRECLCRMKKPMITVFNRSAAETKTAVNRSSDDDDR